jgi:sialic acid synthase SpsE/sugar phosphate isomerase/epimerase
MIITKNLLPYVVSKAGTVREALSKGHKNKVRTLFVVDENGLLYGTLSSGDISKWLLLNKHVDLSSSVSQACNTSYKSVNHGAPPTEIAEQFTTRIDVLPLVDSRGLLLALAFRDRKEIYIGNYRIGEKHPVFIIAEIGNNHNGSIALAKKLIDKAIWAGADCVKFQLRDLSTLYNQTSKTNEDEDLGSQYVLDLLERFNLTAEQMCEVFDYCKEKKILHLCTPWDIKSLSILEQYGIEAYKVASADLTNHNLLIEIAKTGRPMLVSTGMSSEAEIIKSIQLLNDYGAIYVLLHCNSTYPTPYKDINLNYLSRLKELSQGPVGYSGHERGFSVPIAAVALGARVIEKHFTVDRKLEGNDHKVSLEPEEFQNMVKGIRKVEKAFGKDSKRQISQGEMINRENLAKSLIATISIAKGDVIANDMIAIRSPGKGLQPIYIEKLVGKRAKRDIQAGDFFFSSDIEDQQYIPKPFQFRRPWGVPVRFHDFHKIEAISKPDFVEFHLSYKDIELNSSDYIHDKYRTGYMVHAPELFEGDHILDLVSPDEIYLKRSIHNITRVIKLTKILNKSFPSTLKPLIVTNMGGFSQNCHLPLDSRDELYEKLKSSLKQIDTSGVELIAQTMPPFPWHFGGQSYHNLFVDPYEISKFCDDTGLRICLDISHSKLACNYYEWNFKEFIKTVGPYTAHLHIVDAKGIDQEGLQIGSGDIDFEYLGELLDKYCPNSGFIPEIWQGHKNDGEGFWMALTKLEPYL